MRRVAVAVSAKLVVSAFDINRTVAANLGELKMDPNGAPGNRDHLRATRVVLAFAVGAANRGASGVIGETDGKARA